MRDKYTSIGCYVFRNPFTYYEDKGSSVDLIASHCSNEDHIDTFIQGFYNCLSQIDYPYEYLIIENISMNGLIIKRHSPNKKIYF